MRFKTLLLGSATAFAFAGGAAQAADLSVAEPVDYVRVCDAFGAGFWYIPGTDTCIKLGGFIRFETRWYDPDTNIGTSTDVHDASWDFFTRANFAVETKSMTDWGPLTTFFELEGDFSNGAASPTLESAWLSLGPVLMGFTQSAFDRGGGYTYSGLDDGFTGGFPAYTAITDNKLNQIQLSWAMGGFGLILAVEDPRERATDWFGAGGTSNAGDIPDLVAAVTAGGAGWNAAVSFLYADTTGGSTWGANASLELEDLFGTSDRFKVIVAYIDETQGVADRDVLSVLASYRHYWTSRLYSGATVRWDSWNTDLGADGDTWSVAFDTRFEVVDGLTVGGEVRYYDFTDSLRLMFRAQRDYGG